MTGLPYVHHKRAKGRSYWYFSTGATKNGRPILKRLPAPSDPEFPRAYQAARAGRTRRTSVQDERNFDWLCRTYEKSPEFRSLAENSKRNYLRHLGYANHAFSNAYGRSWPLSIIRPIHILELRDKFADQPGKASSIVRAVKALFAWASKPARGYMATNLAEGIDTFDSTPHEQWPEWLLEEGLNDPAVRLPIALLYFTGQRIGDVVKMGRHSIAGGIVSVTQQKTGKSLRIAVHSRLAQIIEADAPDLLFLVNEKGKPLSAAAVRQRLQAWAKGKGVHVVPHGLRRNAVSALLEAGCSTAEVEAITGQSLKMIEHYAAQRDREHLSRAAILKFERAKR